MAKVLRPQRSNSAAAEGGRRQRMVGFHSRLVWIKSDVVFAQLANNEFPPGSVRLPRESTATTEPSTTTLPPMTIPVVACMDE